MANTRSYGFIIACTLAAVGCGGKIDAGNIPGGSCNGADASCGGGTTCLTESVAVGTGCSSMERICTIACTDDQPCIDMFGAGARCSASCQGSQTICLPSL